MNFRVGQKVVCVDASSVKYIVKGQVYEIERVHPPYVTLVGVRTSDGRHGYFATRFRPLIERKTDISTFTEMLKPEPNKPRRRKVLISAGQCR